VFQLFAGRVSVSHAYMRTLRVSGRRSRSVICGSLQGIFSTATGMEFIPFRSRPLANYRHCRAGSAGRPRSNLLDGARRFFRRHAFRRRGRIEAEASGGMRPATNVSRQGTSFVAQRPWADPGRKGKHNVSLRSL
jgi:hypothetical protein